MHCRVISNHFILVVLATWYIRDWCMRWLRRVTRADCKGTARSFGKAFEAGASSVMCLGFAWHTEKYRRRHITSSADRSARSLMSIRRHILHGYRESMAKYSYLGSLRGDISDNDTPSCLPFHPRNSYCWYTSLLRRQLFRGFPLSCA